jgi:hypothetical protein
MMTDFALIERVAANRKDMLQKEDPVCCVEYGVDTDGHRAVVTVGENDEIKSYEFVESSLSWHMFSWEEYRKCLEGGCSVGVVVPNRDPLFPARVRDKVGEIMSELPEEKRENVTGYVFTYNSDGEIKLLNKIR